MSNNPNSKISFTHVYHKQVLNFVSLISIPTFKKVLLIFSFTLSMFPTHLTLNPLIIKYINGKLVSQWLTHQFRIVVSVGEDVCNVWRAWDVLIVAEDVQRVLPLHGGVVAHICRSVAVVVALNLGL